MNRNAFLTQLGSRAWICDGAMGTQLMAAGLQPGACGEQWNIDHAEVIVRIHREYLQAGCDIIMTNTFGASASSLARHGLSAQVAQVNQAAARVAREAAGDEVIVLGDMGPLGDFLEPLGDLSAARARELFAEQARALREGGADAAIIETMSDPAELIAAIEASRQVADWPVIATYSFEANLRTMMGVDIESGIGQAIDAGADVVGTNCGTGLDLDTYARLAERIVAAAKGAPVIIQPNAGKPEHHNGVVTYPATPQDMAKLTRRLIDSGVRIIGGCCGTTPAHIAAMASVVRDTTPV